MENFKTLLNRDALSENKKLNLQIEVDELFSEVAKGAFIRSRVNWLENGEKNTSYFFCIRKT